MLPSRKSWSFTIQFYWHFSKSWSQIQKVGVKNSKFGVNETSGSICKDTDQCHGNCEADLPGFPILIFRTLGTSKLMQIQCMVNMQRHRSVSR